MPRTNPSGPKALLALLGAFFLGCHSSGETPPEAPRTSGITQIGVIDLFKCLRQGTSAQFEALEAARRSWFGSLSKETTAIFKRLEDLRDQVQSLPLDSPLRQDKAVMVVRATDELLSRLDWRGYLNNYTLTLEPMSARIRDAVEQYQKEKRLPLVLFVNRPVLDETLGKLSHEQTARFEGALPTSTVCDITADLIALLRRRGDKNR